MLKCDICLDEYNENYIVINKKCNHCSCYTCLNSYITKTNSLKCIGYKCEHTYTYKTLNNFIKKNKKVLLNTLYILNKTNENNIINSNIMFNFLNSKVLNNNDDNILKYNYESIISDYINIDDSLIIFTFDEYKILIYIIIKIICDDININRYIRLICIIILQVKNKDIIHSRNIPTLIYNTINDIKYKKSKLDSNINIKPCLDDNCSGYLIINNTCSKCKMYTCDMCNISFESKNINKHVCKEDDIKTMESIKEVCKQCPRCGIYIMKNDGCNDMVCTRCNFTFFWSSLKSRPGRDGYDFGIIQKNKDTQSIETYNKSSNIINILYTYINKLTKYYIDNDKILTSYTEKYVLGNINLYEYKNMLLYIYKYNDYFKGINDIYISVYNKINLNLNKKSKLLNREEKLLNITTSMNRNISKLSKEYNIINYINFKYNDNTLTVKGDKIPNVDKFIKNE